MKRKKRRDLVLFKGRFNFLDAVLIILGLLYFFAFLSILAIAYIFIMGNMGWQFFKMNFLLKKRAGTIYLALLRTGRIKFWYARFKTEHKWSDGSITKIVSVEDRSDNFREPIIFLVEGYPMNVSISQLVKGDFPDLGKIFTTLQKTEYVMGMERMDLTSEKRNKLDNIIPLLTLVLVVIAMGAVIYFGMELSGFKSQVLPFIEKFNSIDFNSSQSPTVLRPGGG